MKVLVLANCSHRAYVNYLKSTHPDWDVRAVVIPQANKWLEEKNAAFIAFIGSVDLYIGLTDREPMHSAVNPAARQIFLPSFHFSGFHPDTIWLHGVPSPMEAGVIHSRIAASAFLSGQTVGQAKALFNRAHFEKLGYFDLYEQDRQRVFKVFSDNGYDIADLFETWVANGNFLHTPNHPDIRVFFDIIHLGMGQAGYPPEVSDSQLTSLREATEDYLAVGCIWPIYPEIAAHFDVAATPSQWCTSAAKGEGGKFDLDEMLDKSWAIFRAQPDSRETMINYLGGLDEVARYVDA